MERSCGEDVSRLMLTLTLQQPSEETKLTLFFKLLANLTEVRFFSVQVQLTACFSSSLVSLKLQ